MTIDTDKTATLSSYSKAQKILHWAVVILLVLQYMVFDGMGRYFNQILREGVATYNVTTTVHILIGLLVLVAAGTRLFLRKRHGVPPLPDNTDSRVARLAHGAHILIYVLLFLLPLSGMAAWFGGIEAPGAVHGALTKLLMLTVLVHVAGALVHQFYFKDNLIRRMI
ncbi:MAG: cytochrome b [Qingshengfaniella sp.]